MSGPLFVKNHFELLKTSLMTEPIMTYPDPNLPYMFYSQMQANMLGLVF